MHTSLLGNLSGYFAARQLGTVYARGTISRTRPSATQAIGSTRDDPGRLVLLDQVRIETARLRQGGRNTLHAISMVQAADAGLARMASTLAEALVLAQQATSGGYAQTQVVLMQADFEGLLDELDAIPASVDFDGTNLLTATGDVEISLAERSGDPSPEIRIRTQDLSAQALGLTGSGADPTYATLTASSDQGVGITESPYMKGPSSGPPAELAFTFHGSEGDKVVTIYINKNKSLTDIVDMINSETDALVPGWVGAEAIQVAGLWVLKVTTYEPGEADAPDVAVNGNLKWKSNDPVQPSDFAGQDGSAGSGSGGPLDLTASDTIQKIEDAIENVADLRTDFAALMLRLAVANSALESAAGYSVAAESRINDPDTAREAAASTKRELLGQAGIALLLQGNVTTHVTLQLLGLPSVDEQGTSFALWA